MMSSPPLGQARPARRPGRGAPCGGLRWNVIFYFFVVVAVCRRRL